MFSLWCPNRNAQAKPRINQPLSSTNNAALASKKPTRGAAAVVSSGVPHANKVRAATAYTCDLRGRVITGKVATTRRKTLTRPRRFQFRTDARAHVTAEIRRETHEKLDKMARDLEAKMRQVEEREVKKIRAEASFKAQKTPQYLKRIRKERLRREKENRVLGDDDDGLTNL
jgi:hypothetical protein